MPKVLSLLAVLVFFGTPRLIGEQELPPRGDWCQGKPIGASCWMELSYRPGCYVWNSYLFPDETRTWKGKCVDGFADGLGTLTLFSGGDHMILESAGRFQQGKQHGSWVERSRNGTVAAVPYVKGKRHGQWVGLDADGNVSGGPFEKNQQHGQWVERFQDGSVHEGPRVYGKRHGQWIEILDGRQRCPCRPICGWKTERTLD